MRVSRKKKSHSRFPRRRPHHPIENNDSVKGEWLRDAILGGQDGLVNTLGLILGVATATQDARLVIIAGLAAMFAEGISMGAVAYTSSKAAQEYYDKERRREMQEIDHFPDEEKAEVRSIYRAKGFTGKHLEYIVTKITANRARWLDTMMQEELKIFPERQSPLRSGILVGIAAHVGAIFPLFPFFFFPVSMAVPISLLFSLLVLFLAGAWKGKFTKVPWWRSGLELALIGGLAALVGYLIGAWFGAHG
ncbi:MAG: VIT1/CCC1 transporter family protein [Candidatus Diapherotrites archaeon]|nr:VIT1/CCC1 transporter family protein [Candidatus Diapherotrites archaeon]MDZ4256314.1 VIT1/CCC1 transporter family protein [archaeon]